MLTTPTPTRGALRAARAGVLGGAGLALAAGAHVGAGGGLPGLGGLSFLLAATTAVVLVVTLRRLRVLSLVAALGGLQLALHAGFTLLAPAGDATVVAHGHHHALISVPATASGTDLLMVTLHAVATVLTALLLAHGEALLWLMATAVAPLVLLVGAVRLARALPRPPLPAAVDLPVLRRQHWGLCSPLRGPPLAA